MAYDFDSITYADEGCHLAPSCLNCPLAVCILDDPRQLTRQRKTARDEQIAEALATYDPDQVAQQMGVSVRTIFRVKARLAAAAA